MSYDGIISIPAAAITMIKTYWNSVVSTPDSRCATIDIKDFYLNSKLKDYECMKTHETLTPQEFINACKL